MFSTNDFKFFVEYEKCYGSVNVSMDAVHTKSVLKTLWDDNDKKQIRNRVQNAISYLTFFEKKTPRSFTPARNTGVLNISIAAAIANAFDVNPLYIIGEDKINGEGLTVENIEKYKNATGFSNWYFHYTGNDNQTIYNETLIIRESIFMNDDEIVSIARKYITSVDRQNKNIIEAMDKPLDDYMSMLHALEDKANMNPLSDTNDKLRLIKLILLA